MTIRLAVAAALAGLILPALAMAQEQGGPAASATPLSFSEIERRLTADGFEIREIERYSRSIEVKGIDRTGACMEMHLDPNTGDVLRRESDNSCWRDRRRGRDDRGRGRGRD